ncbi:MAG: hypothetical protein WCE68_17685 [Anaerolineales bacterium]
MNISQILADIHGLEEELLTFERKYGIPSETFTQLLAAVKNPKMTIGFLILGNGRVFTRPG